MILEYVVKHSFRPTEVPNLTLKVGQVLKIESNTGKVLLNGSRFSMNLSAPLERGWIAPVAAPAKTPMIKKKNRGKNV